MEPYEYRWLYEGTGSANIFPEQWAKFTEPLPVSIRAKSASTIMHAYRRLLTNKNTATRRKAASHWWNWEAAVSFLEPHPDRTGPKATESLAILENHYFLHNAWIKPGQLLANAHKLKGIPVTIIHGRYDLVCPAASAEALAVAVSHARLTMVPAAGHAATEKGIATALRMVIERLDMPPAH